MLLFFTIIIAVIIVLLIPVLFDTIRGKGRWGINFNLPNCPNCGTKVPAVRKPTSDRQALWGGWTCSTCGCEMDKWGKEINTVDKNEPEKQIEQARENFIRPYDEKNKTPVERVFEDKE